MNILSLSIGGFPIGNRPMRTTMVACQAQRTMVVPNGTAIFHHDIAQWASAGAQATSRTGLRYMKSTGTHQPSVKERTDDICLQPWETPFEAIDLRESLVQARDQLFHSPLGCLQFLPFHLRGIDIKTGQTDIRIGHPDRKAGRTFPTPLADCPCKDRTRLATVISTRTDKIHIVRSRCQLQTTDSLQHDGRRPPSMNRKDKAYRFALLQHTARRRSQRFVRQQTERVTKPFRQPLSHPTRIACTRKTIYHKDRYKKSRT